MPFPAPGPGNPKSGIRTASPFSGRERAISCFVSSAHGRRSVFASCRSAFPPPADEPAKADQQPGKADGQNNDRQRTGPLRQAEGDRPGLALQQQILAVQPGIRLGPAILTQHPEVVPLAGVRQAAVDRVGRLFQVRVLHRHGIGGARILRAAVCPSHLFRGVGDLVPGC